MRSARNVNTRSEIESEVIVIRSDHVIRTKTRRKIRTRKRTKIRIRRRTRRKRRRAQGVREDHDRATSQVVGNPSHVKRIAVNVAANRAAPPLLVRPVAVTKRRHIARTRRRKNNSYLDTTWKTNRAFLELATHTHTHSITQHTHTYTQTQRTLQITLPIIKT